MTHNKKGAYILAVISDTPYHEGVEYFCRRSLIKLFLCHEDWMESKELMVYKCLWNQSCEHLLDEDEFGQLMKRWPDDSAFDPYPDYDKLPNVIRFCKHCHLFYDHDPEKCPKCDQDVFDIEDKI